MALMKKMTLLKRTLLWLSVISLISFFLLVCIVWQVRGAVRDHGLFHIQTILHHKINTIGMYVDGQCAALNNLTQLISFASQHQNMDEDTSWTKVSNDLDGNLETFAHNNHFYDIFLIMTNGDIALTVKHGKDLHTNLLSGPYRDTQLAHVFRDALKNSKPYHSDFNYYEPSHDYAAFIAKPIVHNGKIIGIVAVQIDNKAIQAVVNDVSELGETGEVLTFVLRNAKPMSMFATRHTKIPSYTFLKLPRDYPIHEALHAGEGEKYIIDQTGDHTVIAWGYQKDLRCGMIVKIDENELLYEWYKQTTSLLLLFFFGVIVVFSMIIIALRSFAKPIQELTRNAILISNGNYDIEINSKQYDHEWQLLTDAFEQMAIEIKQRMSQLKETNSTLITQKSEIEDFSRTLEARIEAKTHSLQEYIAIVDKNIITSQTNEYGIITYVSKAFCQISGYSKEQLVGQNHRIIRHSDMPDELFKNLWATISDGRIWSGEIKNQKSDGSYYWVDTVISPNIEEGKIVGYTAIRHDITDKKRVEELAITDPMTGLYNRRHYIITIQEEMNRAKRHNSSMALMMLDVDYFKRYNDTYGHQAGDDVLIRIAEILKLYTSRSGEYTFRLGGEEFALLISDMSDEEYLYLGHRIRNAVEALAILHEKNDVSAYVTISMGIVVYYPQSAMTHEELYKEADDQLYKAKDQGRNQIILKN